MRIAILCIGFMVTGFSSLFSQSQKDVSGEFSRIYREGEWGRNSDGEGTSGDGSIYANARPYMKMLKRFIKKNHIRSVVDIGCGDWELSKHISWGDIKYYGYDVVDKVIESNRIKYGRKNILFICGDAIHSKLPRADLLICKDVLQHLPNEYISEFISKTKNFKYCLVTNDISCSARANSMMNEDIPIGKWRCVDLTKAPFMVKGKKILAFRAYLNKKEVLLISHPQKSH